MTDRDDIIRMAREAGLGDTGVRAGFIFFQPGADGLERFFQAAYAAGAAAGAAAEREACAKLAESTICDTHLPTGVQVYGTRVAHAIRARSNT